MSEKCLSVPVPASILDKLDSDIDSASVCEYLVEQISDGYAVSPAFACTLLNNALCSCTVISAIKEQIDFFFES